MRIRFTHSRVSVVLPSDCTKQTCRQRERYSRGLGESGDSCRLRRSGGRHWLVGAVATADFRDRTVLCTIELGGARRHSQRMLRHS